MGRKCNDWIGPGWALKRKKPGAWVFTHNREINCMLRLVERPYNRTENDSFLKGQWLLWGMGIRKLIILHNNLPLLITLCVLLWVIFGIPNHCYNKTGSISDRDYFYNCGGSEWKQIIGKRWCKAMTNYNQFHITLAMTKTIPLSHWCPHIPVHQPNSINLKKCKNKLHQQRSSSNSRAN